MSKSITSMTKAELIVVIDTLSTELQATRAQLSVAKATPHKATHVEECREHEYDSVAEAMSNCRKLVAWDTARRYMFVVRGNKVICKIRAAH